MDLKQTLPLWLEPREAAALLGVATNTVRTMAEAGTIGVLRIPGADGKRTAMRYCSAHVRAILEKNYSPPTAGVAAGVGPRTVDDLIGFVSVKPGAVAAMA